MFRIIIDKYKGITLAARATIWFTLTNILQKGFLFLATPIYTRLMSSSEYGRYSIALSWLEIFEIVATFRLGWGGYVVGLTKFEDDRDSYTSSMQMLSIVITSFFLVLYSIFRSFINALTGMDTRTTLVIFGILYALPAIQFWMVRSRVEYRYISVFVLATISSILVVIVGTYAALFFSCKAFAVMLSRFIVQGVFAVFLIWNNCHNNFTIFHETYWKRALCFNVPLLPYYLSMVVLHSSDRIIIGNLCGTSFAAIYSVAYTLASCMQIINQSFTQTIQPLMYKRMKDGNEEKISEIITASLIAVIGFNYIMSLAAPELIRIIAPNEYSEAIWIIPPLCASVVVMYIYQQFVNIEFYFEDSKLIAIASIGAACLNIFLNYMFIPKFGYLAAGYTTLVSYSVFAVCHYFFMIAVTKKNGYNSMFVPVRKMSVLFGIYILMTVVAAIGYKYPAIRVLLAILLVIVVFCRRESISCALKILILSRKE